MNLIYRHTPASSVKVASYFKRHHTTVLYALEKRGGIGKLVYVPGWCPAKFRPKRRAAQ